MLKEMHQIKKYKLSFISVFEDCTYLVLQSRIPVNLWKLLEYFKIIYLSYFPTYVVLRCTFKL